MIRKCYKFYTLIMTLMWVMAAMTASAFAVDDMWTVANRIIVDVYAKIVGISTVLAGLMSAVAVIGAKISNNQHKTDQAWDWLSAFGLHGPLSTASALLSPMLHRSSAALPL